MLLDVFPATMIPNNSFRLVQRRIMKKKVQFRHLPLKTLISLLCFQRFHAIVISKVYVSECEVRKECAAIRQQVVTALQQIGCHVN